jgi:thermitase
VDESADGTSVPPSPAIVDSSLATWTLGAAGQAGGSQVLRNGAPYFGGSGDQLLYQAREVRVHNTLGDWYRVTPTGYELISSAPTGPSPSDTIPPTVSISSPSSTSPSLSGTVTVSVNASDNVAVTRVDLRVNGSTVATGNTAPFLFSWNSATAADGPATLTAAAYDAAGNSAVSPGVTVTIANNGPKDTTAPVLAITSPASFASLSGSATILTSVSDDRGAAGITQLLYIDGALKSTATGKPLSYKWNTRPAAAGLHTIVVTATDGAGNKTTKQVQVTTSGR